MTSPFLFHFRRTCHSSTGNILGLSYEYDLAADMVIDKGTTLHIPAIESDRNPGPVTKKEDIEKGEDKKDRRM